MFRRSKAHYFILTLVLVLAGSLTGCAIPDFSPIPAMTGEAALAYQTISVILTQTASVSSATRIAPSPEVTPQPSLTLQPVETTSLAVVEEAPTPPAVSTPPCDFAAAGNPFDVTIPDGSKMSPGESFVKTWRLVNAGSCVWSRDYRVVYFSGVDMGFRREDPFRGDVNPGEVVDVSLDMVAPSEPGFYQGNYKLRGRSDQLFGIGPEGSSPFWVRIEVIPLDTAVPTQVAPTFTPTAEVLVTGSVLLGKNQAYDLDVAATGSSAGDDFSLSLNEGALVWSPANGSRVVVHGALEPGSEDCKSAVTSSESLVLGVELEGSYLCVRTDRGLPARVYLTRVDPLTPALDIQFVVWSVP